MNRQLANNHCTLSSETSKPDDSFSSPCGSVALHEPFGVQVHLQPATGAHLTGSSRGSSAYHLRLLRRWRRLICWRPSAPRRSPPHWPGTDRPGWGSQPDADTAARTDWPQERLRRQKSAGMAAPESGPGVGGAEGIGAASG